MKWTQQWERKNSEEYAQLLANQNYGCGICSERTRLLVVDHDHITKEIRGLLCYSCNSWLGHHLDRYHRDYVAKALKYVVNPPGAILADGVGATKLCARCDKYVPLTEFYFYRGKPHSYCRPCLSMYNAERNSLKREAVARESEED
jgi:hypothetical protein